MMNAPAARRAELEGLLPGLESPSIIPLAHEGMIALHAVVDADDVWSLLPRLNGDLGTALYLHACLTGTPAFPTIDYF